MWILALFDRVFSFQSVCSQVVHCFVDCLEWDRLSYESRQLHSSQKEISFQNSLKEEILKFLILCVTRSPHNLGHLLLGYVQYSNSLKEESLVLKSIGILFCDGLGGVLSVALNLYATPTIWHTHIHQLLYSVTRSI